MDEDGRGGGVFHDWVGPTVYGSWRVSDTVGPSRQVADPYKGPVSEGLKRPVTGTRTKRVTPFSTRVGLPSSQTVISRLYKGQDPEDGSLVTSSPVPIRSDDPLDTRDRGRNPQITGLGPTMSILGGHMTPFGAPLPHPYLHLTTR